MKYAVVDLGSNTIRLSVYNTLPGGGFDLLFSEKEMAGLANEVSGGALSQTGIRRACDALRRFQRLLELCGVERVKVFATASLRNVRNTKEAVDAIRRETGLLVEVLSGDEEAELGYYGALRTLDLRSGAMFDIGGGSTEIVEVEKGRILRAQSLPVGSLNLFDRYVSKIWPKRRELEAITQAAGKALHAAELPKERAERVCGVGGTARAVLKIANAYYDRPAVERRLTPGQLQELTEVLCRRDADARKLILRSCPDRIHTILPGLMMMNAVCEALCEKEIYVSRYGVREGYLCRRILESGI